MSSARDHFSSMLDLLISECLQAKVHVRIWKRLTAFADRQPEPVSLPWYRFFFWMTSKAHAETALSHAFRLIDNSRSGVHIEQLLTYATAHPELFTGADKSDVKHQIKKDRKRLAGLAPTIAKLHKQRNKYFAHLAREYLSKPERQVLREHAVEPDAVNQLLEELADIINGYSAQLRGSTRLMVVVGEEGKVDHLLDHLEESAKSRINQVRTRRVGVNKPVQPR